MSLPQHVVAGTCMPARCAPLPGSPGRREAGVKGPASFQWPCGRSAC